jgi:DNA-directed RNA polymerase specialized sigma24 family protein
MDESVHVFSELAQSEVGCSLALSRAGTGNPFFVCEGYMQSIQDLNHDSASLYSLAFLITGEAGISIDLVVEALALQTDSRDLFSDLTPRDMRRLVIAEALGTIRHNLTVSARRVRTSCWVEPEFSPLNSHLEQELTRPQFEQAMLALDVFPRCVLLLCIFEGLSRDEAAALLDVDSTLVANAQASGLCELTRNVVRGAELRAAGQAELALA